MKFDYIIQNPPYSGSLHLDFLNKGLDILDNKGKMVIIEPSTWLINVRKTGKAELYDKVKSRLNNHVYKVIIENLNFEFETSMYVPFAITYIDFNQEFEKIDFFCCGEHKIVEHLYDCNMIGSYDMIWSILNKVKSYTEITGTLKNHIYKPGKTEITEDTWFCKYGDIISWSGTSGAGRFTKSDFLTKDSYYTKHACGDFYNPYISAYYISKFQLSDKPFNAIWSDKIADQLYGTKQELENWRYNISNTKIPLFLSMTLINQQSNTIKDFMPWLVDKKYNDEELYMMLCITEQEQQFIDKTIKKFERTSPFFKRYMCGKDSVTSCEVQAFLDK